MKKEKRRAVTLMLPLLALLVFSSVSYALTPQVTATVTVVTGCQKLVVTILSPQGKAYSQNSIPLTFKVNGTVSSMAYSLDGSSNVTISGNTTLTSLSQGAHSVTVYVKNSCGSWTSSKVSFTVDTTVPTVTITSPVNGGYYFKLDVPLKFLVSEPTSWIGYSLNGRKNVTIKGNIDMDVHDGSNNVIVYANDSAGNTGASGKVSFFYCQADINGDKTVNMKDYNIVINAFGTSPGNKKWNSNADLNDDNRVNVIDLLILLFNYGDRCR